MATGVPPPVDPAAHPRDLLRALADAIGEQPAAEACAVMLEGGAPDGIGRALDYLGGRATTAYLEGRWPAYWGRVWGARGLLYVWAPSAAGVVVAGLADPAWRVAEMCVKVSVRRELGGRPGCGPSR